MALRYVQGSIDTTGGAGVSAGSATITVSGHIEWVYLDWHASAPSTSDLTLAYATLPTGNILAVTNTSTDTLYYPRAKPVDNANSAITNAHTRFAANGRVTATIAQCDDLTAACIVTVCYQA